MIAWRTRFHIILIDINFSETIYFKPSSAVIMISNMLNQADLLHSIAFIHNSKIQLFTKTKLLILSLPCSYFVSTTKFIILLLFVVL